MNKINANCLERSRKFDFESRHDSEELITCRSFCFRPFRIIPFVLHDYSYYLGSLCDPKENALSKNACFKYHNEAIMTFLIMK